MNDHTARTIAHFDDLAQNLDLGKNLQADQRIQVKMPARVVSELDRLFPDTDRSAILTQLATQAISTRLRFADRSVLRAQQAGQQDGLDTMLSYLEDRDAGII